MNKVYLYSHNPASESAKALAIRLEIPRIRHTSSKFVGASSKTVINWGSSTLPGHLNGCVILNTPEAVDMCCNKLAFFKAVDGKCNTPDFTSNSEQACIWLEKKGIVFARTILRGSGGDGIVEIDDAENMVPAELYTRYIPKAEEYRVHVMAGRVFLVQRKAFKGRARKNTNWHVRNTANGFIFARNEGKEPEEGVLEQALLAFNCIKGLTFGSVDIIYNKHRDKAYVLEINTASGLAGTTVDDYGNAFEEYFNA